MKYKILIILILGTIITSFIYFHVDKSKQNLLALGDGISTGMTAYHVEGYDFNDYFVEYLNENNQLDTYYRLFNETDETVSNLINKINNNITSMDTNIKIKQAIKEADIITIALGMDELNNYAAKNNLGSTKMNGFINKYQELLTYLRSLNNKKIYVISLYPSKLINSTKIDKINKELKTICEKNAINFIDISNMNQGKEFFSVPNNYYTNYKGQKYIFEKIKSIQNELSTFKII